MTATRARTRSEIGRSAVALGKETERRLVRDALKPYWPDDPDDPVEGCGAHRSRDNGSAYTPDTGDIAGTDPRLFWSVKAVRDTYPALYTEWMIEMREKAGPSRIGVLVERRWGSADPRSWWAWLWADDHYRLMTRIADDGWRAPVPEQAHNWRVRLQVCELLELLAAAGWTDAIPEAS